MSLIKKENETYGFKYYSNNIIINKNNLCWKHGFTSLSLSLSLLLAITIGWYLQLALSIWTKPMNTSFHVACFKQV